LIGVSGLRPIKKRPSSERLSWPAPGSEDAE
jgi:hypothetical protein